MRYRLWKKEDGDKKFKPSQDCRSLPEAARIINGSEYPHKVWDFQAEDWVDPYVVFYACLMSLPQNK